MMQLQLFDRDPGDLLGLAYGLGVDSTAILIRLHQLNIRPDFILFADVGSEKQATYDYLPIIQGWLKSVKFPPANIVRYIPPKAPYRTIEENLVMNRTLPGATFGRASCTVKWKIYPQNRWTDQDPLCIAAKLYGRTITKMIGFDAGEEYRKKRSSEKAHISNDDMCYEYPLIDWGWDREECKSRIREAGLIVPPKSACVFCPNIDAGELIDMTPEERGRIIRMEVMAQPYNRKMHGLWRLPRKKDGRPGSITEYIVKNEIEFVMPDDEMPLNPACSKNRGGPIPKISNGAPDLAMLLETVAHNQIIEAI